MKKKAVVFLAMLLFLVSVCLPIAEAHAAIKEAAGNGFMSVSGKAVTFGGNTFSSSAEDIIRITAILLEQRDGSWHEVDRVGKTKYNASYVSASKTTTVSGGHYYRVKVIHYTKTGTVEISSSSYTAKQWIPA